MDSNPKHPWYRSSVAQCAFAVCVIYHLFFAPWFAFNVALQNDEGCYVAILYKLLFQSSEGFCSGRINYFAPGAPFLWLPAGGFALALSSLSQLWLFHWLQPILGLYSFCLFGAATYVLYLCVSRFLETPVSKIPTSPWLLTLAVILNSPILYYAGTWAIMPHTAQILVAFVTVLLLERRKFFLAGLAVLLLSLTRFNDVPAILMLLGKAWDERSTWREGAARLFHRKIAVFAVAALLLSVTVFIGWTAFVKGYGPTTLSNLFLSVSMAKLNFFLFHDRWGVFWMTPWWTLSFVFGLAHFRRLSNFARGALVWLFIEGYVATSWGGNGGDFGYRYLLGSFAAAWVIWKEVVALHGPRFQKVFVGLSVVGAGWMTYLNIAYRSITELTPVMVQVPNAPPGTLVFGGLSHFQVEALKHVFDPNLYAGWFNRDFPLRQLWMIWVDLPDNPSVRGTDQLVLAISALASLFYIVVFARRNLSHFLACRKASRKAGTEIPSASSAPPESLSGP
ncbi:MAG: hypothetical protein JST04_17090 [Bdellovibrionales bacterium]|nr:hypothetical protein [Bdellovibrionales bacterium]